MNKNPQLHLENLTNAGKGRPKGSKDKIRFNSIITNEKLQKVIEELYRIALEGKNDKDRLTAASIILDRALGKVALEINQTVTESSTLSELLNNEPHDTDTETLDGK